MIHFIIFSKLLFKHKKSKKPQVKRIVLFKEGKKKEKQSKKKQTL